MFSLPLVPVVVAQRTPSFANLKITQSSIFTALGIAFVTSTPLIPLHAPFIVRPLSVTTSVAAVAALTLMMTPVVSDARMPARVPVPSIVIDLVIVTAPKPPGFNASISPQAADFEIAPAKVLHGAVRLQGLASSPTPDTQVRVACA